MMSVKMKEIVVIVQVRAAAAAAAGTVASHVYTVIIAVMLTANKYH